MPRYYFDLHDGQFIHDDVGVECADFDAVRREAKRALPAMALDVLPKDGDQHNITVIVRDESNRTIYTATLSFTGLTIPITI